MTHPVASPRLLPFNPLVDPIPEFRKPLTPTPVFSIAPLKTPHYESIGTLYFRLSKYDDCTVLLTAAHIARPPPAYATKGISHEQASQPREEIIALGNMGYEGAMDTMMAAIRALARSVAVWRINVIARRGELVDL